MPPTSGTARLQQSSDGAEEAASETRALMRHTETGAAAYSLAGANNKIQIILTAFGS